MNEKNLFDFRLGGELTDLGKIQAQLRGITLKNIEFSKIYCSKSNRTKETLNNILLNHYQTSDFSIHYVDELLEINYFSLEEKSNELIFQKLKNENQNLNIRLRRTDVNDENMAEVFFRASKFLDKLIKENVYSDYDSGINEENYIKINDFKEDGYIYKKKEIDELIKENKFRNGNGDDVKIDNKILVVTHGGVIAEIVSNISYRLCKRFYYCYTTNASLTKIKFWFDEKEKEVKIDLVCFSSDE